MGGPLRWTGYEARLLRLALRMSVRAFAAHLGVAERTVSNWERGGSGITPWPETQAILDTALARADDGSRERFASALDRDAAGSHTSAISTGAQAWDVAATLERAAATLEEVDLVPPSRRSVLAGAGVVAGATLIAELQPFLLPAATADNGREKAFTTAELDVLEQLVDHIGSQHRRAVMATLKEHTTRLRNAPQGTPETQRAFRVGSRIAGLAADMHWDVELHATAQRCFVLSAQLAHAIGEEALAASALAALARQCVDLGRPDDGLEVVQLAQYVSRRQATPRLKALMATREAWAHAMLGDARAFCRTVAVAEDHFAEGERDLDRKTPAVRSLDLAELSGVIGARYRDLALIDQRYARTAQRYIGSALALRNPARMRNRAFDLIGMARAHLISREPDQSAALVRQVLVTSGSWLNGRVGTRLRVFCREAAQFSAVPDIREVRHGITELVGSR